MHLDTFSISPGFNGKFENQECTISGTLKRYSGEIAHGDTLYADEPKENMAYLVFKVVRSDNVKSYTPYAMVRVPDETSESGGTKLRNVANITWNDFIVLRMDVAEKRPEELTLEMQFEDEDGQIKNFTYTVNNLDTVAIDPVT